MTDQRNVELAKVFVEHSMDVQKGDKVVISTSDLTPIDIIREVYKLCLQKGAYVYLDIMGFNFFQDRSSYGDLSKIFYDYASEDQINNPSEIYKHISEWGDKYIRITTLDNYSHIANVDSKSVQLKSKSYHDWFRTIIDEKKWVLTYYPTEAMAQKAGISMSELEEFYFSATLVDYQAMVEVGDKLQNLMDNANEVRIVGEKTDLLIDITGRLADNSAGTANVPDGEVFLAPVHTNTSGHIYYDLPFAKNGKDIVGAYLEFENGKVVKATAEQGEDVLLAGLDTDDGAKYLGELGLGMNYGIQNVMKNTMFDEKIGGTVHVTLGEAYTYERGGNPDESTRNISGIHWDLVKDMRIPGSKIEVDGIIKFEDGKWLL
jgi:aminopeptidase